MKIVINKGYGGFSLSEVAYKELGLQGPYDPIARNDPRLVEVVERLGGAADGQCALGTRLEVIEIPDDVEWEIGEYGGTERVEEVHRVWY